MNLIYGKGVVAGILPDVADCLAHLSGAVM